MILANYSMVIRERNLLLSGLELVLFLVSSVFD